MTDGGSRVGHRSLGAADVVEFEGELDLVNADVLVAALAATTASIVILDLGAVDFIDSAALRALDVGNRELDTVGRRLVLVAPPGSRAAFTLRVAGFPDGAVFDSVDSVLRSVGSL
jgi:anti-anti-sigma factor